MALFASNNVGSRLIVDAFRQLAVDADELDIIRHGEAEQCTLGNTGNHVLATDRNSNKGGCMFIYLYAEAIRPQVLSLFSSGYHVSPAYHQRITSVSPAYHLRITCVSPAYHLRITCVSPAYHWRITGVSHDTHITAYHCILPHNIAYNGRITCVSPRITSVSPAEHIYGDEFLSRPPLGATPECHSDAHCLFQLTFFLLGPFFPIFVCEAFRVREIEWAPIRWLHFVPHHGRGNPSTKLEN